MVKPPAVPKPDSNWMRTSITLKMFSIGFLVLLLLIPSFMILNTLQERKTRRDEAITEIGGKWGGAQLIGGPVLTVPCRSTFVDEKGKRIPTVLYVHFLPENLVMDGQITAEKRRRGIYEAVLYNLKLKISGQFLKPSFEGLSQRNEDILWNDAFISLGLTDFKGIKEAVDVHWNEQTIPLNSGIVTQDVFANGLSAGLSPTQIKKESSDFSLTLDVNGSGSLNFLPFGKTTDVHLHSAWKDPSFQGAYLPEKRTVEANGFDSSWKVLHLNRPFPQKWVGSLTTAFDSSFGVALYVPADQYQKTERAAKYAVLFVFLTFLVFFFSEILNRRSLHVIQYLMVGSAVVLFYLLLLSISEQLGFNVAYLIASMATISMVAGYAHGVLSDKRVTAVVGGFMSALYAFLFILLKMEDYALLLGSLGLFVTLAVVMYLTRKFDWHNLSTGKEEE